MTFHKMVLESNASRSRLSLVAQFDDIVRFSRPLNDGIEQEFIAFAQAQKENNKKWHEAIEEISSLKREMVKYKHERDLFETKWKHAMSLIDSEMQKRQKVEKEKKSLERQIALIKEVLLSDQNAFNDQTKERLAFLSANPPLGSKDVSPRRLGTIEESLGSMLSSSDVSFDKTDEDLEDNALYPNLCFRRQSRSKRSYNEQKSGSKRPKLVQDEDIWLDIDADEEEVYDKKTDSDSEPPPASRTRSKRCYSEPAPTSEVPPPPRQTCKSDENMLDNRVFTGEETSSPLRRLSSAGKINRAHVFCTKTVIRPETCYACGHRIKFYKQALKCQDCRITCHPECKEGVPLPCFPSMHTPSNKGQATLQDFASSTSPRIPSLIVHCVNEVESRGLNEVGLYRVSGSEREVRELKEKFLKGKNIPSLNKVDIHAICGTVKEFLRSLPEPLIPRKLWREFVNVVLHETQSDNQQSSLDQVITRLPRPNQDTLAFLMLHLTSVAASPDCKMPVENLARVFGPTIVGYSVAQPSHEDMVLETKYQFAVMQALLSMSIDYWKKFICPSEDEVQIATPETRATPDGNRLGPLTAGSRTMSCRSRGVTLAKTPLTPRCQSVGITKSKRFFTSPLLK